jgi:AICAR transformylase/IMP cyclohydrolase PurH
MSALIRLSDKTELLNLQRSLHIRSEIISTGGTYAKLRSRCTAIEIQRN